MWSVFVDKRVVRHCWLLLLGALFPTRLMACEPTPSTPFELVLPFFNAAYMGIILLVAGIFTLVEALCENWKHAQYFAIVSALSFFLGIAVFNRGLALFPSGDIANYRSCIRKFHDLLQTTSLNIDQISKGPPVLLKRQTLN